MEYTKGWKGARRKEERGEESGERRREKRFAFLSMNQQCYFEDTAVLVGDVDGMWRAHSENNSVYILCRG
jgi:hypothetical protein